MTTIFEWLQEHTPRRDPVYDDVGLARYDLHQLQIDIEQVLSSYQDLGPEVLETKAAEWRCKVEECRELTAPSGLFAP